MSSVITYNVVPEKKPCSGSEKSEAKAVLLNMEQTGRYASGRTHVKLQVQVQPKDDQHFLAELHEQISFRDLSQLYIGVGLIVKYDQAKSVQLLTHASH